MNCPLCHFSSHTQTGKIDEYDICRCNNCGLMHADPMPTLEQLKDYYAEYEVNKKNIVRDTQKVRRWQRRLFLLTLFAPRGRFLDIGCNTGFAVEAARRYGYQAHGIDLGRESIEIARDLYPQCQFDLRSAQTLAERGEMFDLVTCSEMIEHLTELDSFIAALRALVRPGGMLYLTTPDVDHRLVPKDKVKWENICPPHHLIYFGKPQIQRLLQENGFKVLFFYPMLHKPNLRVVARRL